MLIIVRKALSWVEFSGHGAFLMASNFSSVGETPSADMTQRIKVTNCCVNSLLLGWSCNQNCLGNGEQSSDSECAVDHPVPWSECHVEWLQHAQDLEEWCPWSAEKLLGMMQYQKVAFCTNTDHNVNWWLQTADCQVPMGVSDEHSLSQACWIVLTFAAWQRHSQAEKLDTEECWIGYYSNSIVSTRPRGAISLRDMNHGGCPQAEFDLFHNTFGFKLVTFALNCFLESTRYWAGQYWFSIRFLLQFGCDSFSSTKARLEDIRATLDCGVQLCLYIMWEACSWDTDTAYWLPIHFDTRKPIFFQRGMVARL